MFFYYLPGPDMIPHKFYEYYKPDKMHREWSVFLVRSPLYEAGVLPERMTLGSTRKFSGSPGHWDTSTEVVMPEDQISELNALRKQVAELEDRQKRSTRCELCHQAIEASTAGIWEWPDLTKDEFYWSPRYLGILGYEEGELTPNAETFIQLLLPADRTEFAEHIQHAMQSDEPFRYTFQVQKKGGEVIWCAITGQTFLNRDTGRKTMVGLLRNITGQKRIEEQIHDTAQRLDLVLRSSRIGMWEWNILTGDLVVDKLWAQMLGYELGEVQPAKVELFFETLHPDDMAVSKKELDQHLAGDSEFYECQLRLKHKAGHWIWVLARGQVVEWDEGRIPERLLGTHLEISDIKENELQRQELAAQVLQSQKLESLGVLAGGIAHDFNNILMVIQGHAEMATADLPAESPVQDSLRQIKSSVEKATGLCSQMLAYSGRGSFLTSAIRLDVVLADMRSLLQTSVTHLVVLDIQSTGEVLPIKADLTQIRQVVMNLVINGAEAMGTKGGKVTVKTGTREFPQSEIDRDFDDANLKEGQYTYLVIEDEGCGMDVETRSRVFEPFFTTKFTGRGLGMSAVQGIVRAHLGGLHLVTSPGTGTSFTLIFPITKEKAIAAGTDPERIFSDFVGEGTILVVDDEPIVMQLAEQMLEKIGFSHLSACNSPEAVKIFEQRHEDIQCVLLDLTMPEMDGEEVFLELRRIDPEVKVVMCSGFSEKEIERRFFGKGLGGFLHKPYSLNELRHELGNLLG